MTDLKYLRSRQRRNTKRWFHTYRRDGKEISLGVNGLSPDDARVLAAYAAAHLRWEQAPPGRAEPRAQTFAWAVDLYKGSRKWESLALSTQQNRLAIYRRYIKAEGERPLSSITTDFIEAGLYSKGGHAAINEFKALKPVFAHLKKLRIIKKDPMAGVDIERPKIKGFPTAGADEIERFQRRWPVGTTERLTFDLGLYTGAARVDLARLSRRNIQDGLLSYRRKKTGVSADIPMTNELRAVIAKTPDIAPAFILSERNKPFTAASLGNMFATAATAAGIGARLHGLRKAFCVYWAEKGMTTHQIAAMAGHLSLKEVEHYTRDADRKRIVRLLVKSR